MLSLKLLIAAVNLVLWLSAVMTLDCTFLWLSIYFFNCSSNVGISDFAAFVFARSWSIISIKFAIALFVFICLWKIALTFIISADIWFLVAAVLGAWACSMSIGVVLMLSGVAPVGRSGVG